jgi:hypothetical protein
MFVMLTSDNNEQTNRVHVNHRVFVTHWLTPFFPSIDMLVRDISGRIQARSRRCSGNRIQSSQNLIETNNARCHQCNRSYPDGQLPLISFHIVRVNSQPRPGKKSVRCKSAGSISNIVRFIVELGHVSSNLAREQSSDRFRCHSKPIHTRALDHWSTTDTMHENNRENQAILLNRLEFVRIIMSERERKNNNKSIEQLMRIVSISNEWCTFSDYNCIVIQCIENVIDRIIVMSCDFIVATHMTKLFGYMNRSEIGQLDCRQCRSIDSIDVQCLLR